MSIITNMIYGSGKSSGVCRYYACQQKKRGKSGVKCVRFNSYEEYSKYLLENDKLVIKDYIYCSHLNSKILDRFCIFANNLNFRLPIIVDR